jgi:hypothetical protein
VGVSVSGKAEKGVRVAEIGVKLAVSVGNITHIEDDSSRKRPCKIEHLGNRTKRNGSAECFNYLF